MLPILSSLPPKCFLWHHPFSASAQLYGWMFYCMIVYIWKYLCRFRNEERKQEINLKLNGIYSNYVDLKDILIGKKSKLLKCLGRDMASEGIVEEAPYMGLTKWLSGWRHLPPSWQSSTPVFIGNAHAHHGTCEPTHTVTWIHAKINKWCNKKECLKWTHPKKLRLRTGKIQLAFFFFKSRRLNRENKMSNEFRLKICFRYSRILDFMEVAISPMLSSDTANDDQKIISMHFLLLNISINMWFQNKMMLGKLESQELLLFSSNLVLFDNYSVCLSSPHLLWSGFLFGWLLRKCNLQ